MTGTALGVSFALDHALGVEKPVVSLWYVLVGSSRLWHGLARIWQETDTIFDGYVVLWIVLWGSLLL